MFIILLCIIVLSIKYMCVKTKLFYITLFATTSHVKGNNQLYKNFDNYIYNLNTTKLSESFHYTFQKHYCVQIIEDKSFISLQLVKIIHNLPRVPTFLLGVINSTVNCHDRIYVSSNLKVFIKLLKLFPMYKRKFLSIIIDDNNENFLQRLVNQGTSDYLNNSYGIVVVLNAPYFLYKYISLHKTFKELMVSDLKHKQEEINNWNFRGRKLKVGTYNCTINSQVGPLDKDGKPSWFEGIEMKFLNVIATKLNFTYEIVVPKDRVSGTVDKNGHWTGGLMKLIGEKVVDVAFCGIFMSTYNRMSPLDLTTPINDICITLLVPRPLPFDQNGLGLFSSFRWEVWATVFLSLLGVTLFMQQIASVSAKKYFGTSRFMKFQNSLLTLWGVLFNNAPVSSSILGPIRHTMLWWGIFALLLETFFSSSLVTRLTRTLYDQPLTTIQELVENDYYWFLPFRPTFSVVFDLEDVWLRKWVNKFWVVDNMEKQCHLIKEAKWKLAFPATKYMDGVILQHNLSCQGILTKYQLLPQCLRKFRTAFVLQEKSPYTKVFSDYITRYQESGIFIKEYRDTFYSKILKENYIHEVEIYTNNKNNERVVLKLSNTSSIFFILVLGITLSTLVFMFELFWYYKSTLFQFF